MKKKELTHYLLDSMVGTRYTLESLQERLNCVSDEKVEIAVVDEEELILAEDFSTIGINYVSCSPFRVPIARLAAAQAEIKQNA